MSNKSRAQKEKSVKVNTPRAVISQPQVGISLDKRFELIREQIKHEDELINQRLNWLLLSQGLLFAAFTALVTADTSKIAINLKTFYSIAAWIPITGLALNLFSFSGLDAAYQSLKYLRENWRNYQPCSQQDQEYYDSFPQITWRKPAITTASATPIVISLVWLPLALSFNVIGWYFLPIGLFFGGAIFWMGFSTWQNHK